MLLFVYANLIGLDTWIIFHRHKSYVCTKVDSYTSHYTCYIRKTTMEEPPLCAATGLGLVVENEENGNTALIYLACTYVMMLYYCVLINHSLYLHPNMCTVFAVSEWCQWNMRAHSQYVYMCKAKTELQPISHYNQRLKHKTQSKMRSLYVFTECCETMWSNFIYLILVIRWHTWNCSQRPCIFFFFFF